MLSLDTLGRWPSGRTALVVLLALAACNDDGPTAPVIPVPANPGELSGVWSFTDTTVATTPVEQTTCRNQGVITFTSTAAATLADARLVGTCISPRGPAGASATLLANQVTMVGDSIAFTASGGSGSQAESCEYRGRLTGGSALGGHGTVSCVRRGPGHWEMTWGPPEAPALEKFTMIDIGGAHTCALDTSGQAWCWGINSYGHLGTGDDAPRLVPAKVTGSVRFTSIAVASEGPVTCGLTAAGEAYCWGNSRGGVLGDGSGAVEGSRVMAPQRVVGGHTFKQIATAGSHTCAITTAGAAYCWGMNTLGQLGTGTNAPSSTPVAVTGGITFAQIDTYTNNTCGVSTNGKAYCWGEGWSGILGNGDESDSNVPVPVSGNLTFASVSVGFWMACGLTTSGDGYCWGSGGRGLGTGDDTGFSTTPLLVTGGLKWKSITAGGFVACGVTTTSSGYCWGDNFEGALGRGESIKTGSNHPVPIAGNLAFAQVVIDWHGCGLTVAGAAYCWSSGAYGQVGDGYLRTRWGPVKVAGQP